MNRLTASLAATALLAAGALAGCSDDADELLPRGETVTDNPEQPGGAGPPESESPSEPGTSTGSEEDSDSGLPETINLRSTDMPVSAQDAIDTATSEAGGGFVYSIEMDYSRSASAWVYEVKVLDGTTKHEYDIGAETGEVLEHETDSTDDEEREITLEEPMTFAEALEAATTEVNEPLRGWKYEWDDGRLIYEFDLGSPRDTVEITVDAETGQTFRD